jgi:microcystin-dependent protein
MNMQKLLALAILAGSLSPGCALANEPFLGEMRILAASFCPKGHAPARGQLLPINQNQALFALLGTTYGGDGRTTFALPTAAPLLTVTGAPLQQCIALVGIFPSMN